MFKNAIAYKFSERFDPCILDLNVKLEHYQTRKPTDGETFTLGFTPPRNRTYANYAERVSVHGQTAYMCAVKRIEKIIPAAAIADILTEKVAQIEEEQNRKLGKKERTALKDEIISSLLPKALTKSSITKAYIDVRNQFIVVDAASTKKAEELLSLLRKALGSLPVIQLSLSNAFAAPTYLTNWARDGYTDHPAFSAEEEASLNGADGEKITLKNQPLSVDDITPLFGNGKTVSKLALNYKDQLTLVLTDDLQIKRIKPLDILTETIIAEQEGQEDDFEGDAIITVETISALVNDIGVAMGGYYDPQAEEADSISI